MPPKYYDVFEDIEKYPDAYIIIAYSRRSVGKTYGALWGYMQRKQPIVYIKRTNRDIDLICKPLNHYKNSPYHPINRDHGTNILPIKESEGMAGFYPCDDNDEPIGPAVAYALSLNNIKSIKGFSLDDAEAVIMDEFIPQASESRVMSTEFDGLMDSVLTVQRDRIERGRDALRLLLFANAERLYCPIIDGLEILSELGLVASRKLTYYYLEERQILIHHINDIPLDEKVTKKGMYVCMKGTAWWRKSYYGEFAHCDFTNIKDVVLKKYQPVARCWYREKAFYIYRKDRDYHICETENNKYRQEFNFDRDNDIRLFYGRLCFDLQEACTMGHVTFSNYALYDLIMNFDKRFKGVL